MPEKIEELVRAALAAAQEAGDLSAFELDDCAIERPADTSHGEWTSTMALKSAKLAHCAPRKIAEAVVVELGGEFVGLVPCGLAEGAAQGQILDGVPGEGHFRENNHLGVSCGGFTGVVEHLGGVGVKRADAGVNLGECEAKLCHSFLV